MEKLSVLVCFFFAFSLSLAERMSWNDKLNIRTHIFWNSIIIKFFCVFLRKHLMHSIECTRNQPLGMPNSNETGMQFDEQLKLHFTRQNVKFLRFRLRAYWFQCTLCRTPIADRCKDARALCSHHYSLSLSQAHTHTDRHTRTTKYHPTEISCQVRVRMFIIL